MKMAVLTTSATATGGREGRVESEDYVLQFDTAMPGTPRAKELEDATNPEQLFAAGYASCFDGALNLIAGKEKVKLDSETTASVSLLNDETDKGFKLAVKLTVKAAGVEKSVLENLVHKAHDFCPYSKATRGNIDVQLEVVTA
ncbi:MAG TPA: organic hydroperoxide resistance protein [Niallia sp.]|nr:organic hydroperoxide resistance protein [Niallia sp.]